MKFPTRKFHINWKPQVHLNQQFIEVLHVTAIRGMFFQKLWTANLWHVTEHQAWIWVTHQTFCISPKLFVFSLCLLILSFCFPVFSNIDRNLNNWKIIGTWNNWKTIFCCCEDLCLSALGLFPSFCFVRKDPRVGHAVFCTVWQRQQWFWRPSIKAGFWLVLSSSCTLLPPTVLCSLDLQKLSMSCRPALLTLPCREQITVHSETWVLVMKAA